MGDLLPVVVAIAVGFALLALAPLWAFCRASRWKQDEAWAHVHELEAWGYSDEEWDGLAAELAKATIEPEDAA